MKISENILACFTQGDQVRGMTIREIAYSIGELAQPVDDALTACMSRTFVESRREGETWASGAPSPAESRPIGRTPRRFYRLTDDGRRFITLTATEQPVRRGIMGVFRPQRRSA